MAISAVHYRLMCGVRECLPAGGDVLQIGDANWYGDLDPLVMLELTDDPERMAIVRRAAASRDLFAMAKAFYAALFGPKRVDSIDMHGAIGSMRMDLNKPVQLERQYDLTVNHGTAEHVFGIEQVFRTMHDWTRDGGLMIHEAPCTGWPDHGFYTLQPTLFYDLAAVNGYELVKLALADFDTGAVIDVAERAEMHRLVIERRVPATSLLFVVLRKRGAGAFRVPMQGYYDGQLSSEGKQAWQGAR